ncbi:uncharacterized protein DS421_3g66750 [Arachis hypogaea]|nr:uncharacterized protein DS421_3g66750 [Arachis hypogaea]
MFIITLQTFIYTNILFLFYFPDKIFYASFFFFFFLSVDWTTPNSRYTTHPHTPHIFITFFLNCIL